MAANTFANDFARASDSVFRIQVQSALFKLASAVIGEAVANPPSATAVGKRHNWIVGAINSLDRQLPVIASMVAGTSTIRSVDMPTAIPDATVESALSSVISDLAGVLNSEA